MAFPADQFDLNYNGTPLVEDRYLVSDQIFGVGAHPPGSVVNMRPEVPFWHGKPPYKVMETPALPWGSQDILDKAVIGTGYFRIAPTPPPDHRYDKILEEFGAKPVKPAAVPYTSEPTIWTPPPGAFPEPEPETVLSFPKGDEWEREIGRWRCSVIVKVNRPPQRMTDWQEFPKWTIQDERMWLQVEPRGDPCLPMYQRWSTTKDTGRELNEIFLDWVTEIEANPDCCVKHKLIGKYDGTDCVGQRSTPPPVALAPEAEKEEGDGSLFNPRGTFNYKQAVAQMSPTFIWGGVRRGFNINGL